MLKEFYKKVNAKGFGSLEFSRYWKISKAIGTETQNVVDEEDAKSNGVYNIMLVKFQKSVVYSETPVLSICGVEC
jgi:hypothetical protein